MARARRSTALKVKSYAQDSGSEEEDDEDEEMKVEGELESEFEETASVGSKRSTKSVQEDYVEDTEGKSTSPSSLLPLSFHWPHSDPSLSPFSSQTLFQTKRRRVRVKGKAKQ